MTPYIWFYMGLEATYFIGEIFQNSRSPECAFCTPLCTFSVLTYALTDKKTSKWQDSTFCILPLGHAKLQTNDKTQLSASFPWGMQDCKYMTRLNSLHLCLGACKTANTWQDSTFCILPLGHAKLQTNDKTQLSASFPWGMQNCKHMTRLNSLHPSLGACKTANKNQKTKKTTTLCLRHSGPVGFLGFLVVFSVYVFFVFLGFPHFAWMYHCLGSQSASVNILLVCPYSPCPFPSSHTMKGQPMPTQPHLWISSKCACFFDFLMVWAPSQKVT